MMRPLASFSRTGVLGRLTEILPSNFPFRESVPYVRCFCKTQMANTRLSDFSVAQLKEQCQFHQLPSSGRKADLQERLRLHLESETKKESENKLRVEKQVAGARILDFTAAQLKEECQFHQLPLSGRKADLQERLRLHLELETKKESENKLPLEKTKKAGGQHHVCDMVVKIESAICSKASARENTNAAHKARNDPPKDPPSKMSASKGVKKRKTLPTVEPVFLPQKAPEKLEKLSKNLPSKKSASKDGKKRKAPTSVQLEKTPEQLEKAEQIRKYLNTMYPDPPVPLNHHDIFTLLVAVCLSAQTTDGKVNEV
jgi:hypothetical protein